MSTSRVVSGQSGAGRGNLHGVQLREPGAHQALRIGVGARQQKQDAAFGTAERAGDGDALAHVDAVGHGARRR